MDFNEQQLKNEAELLQIVLREIRSLKESRDIEKDIKSLFALEEKISHI